MQGLLFIFNLATAIIHYIEFILKYLLLIDLNKYIIYLYMFILLPYNLRI